MAGMMQPQQQPEEQPMTLDRIMQMIGGGADGLINFMRGLGGEQSGLQQYPQEVKDETIRRVDEMLIGSGMENDPRIRVKYFNQMIPEVIKEFQRQNGQQ